MSTKISQLPAATSPVDPSVTLPVVQAGQTRQAAIDQLGFLQSGVSATTRTIQNKLREIVSVKDFGAVGDGSTDDTAAIQLAIDSGAQAVYFPEGVYKITVELTITSPVVIYGDGAKASVIRQTDASANGLNFDFASLVQGGGVLNISVEAGAGWVASGFQGSGSSGIGIRVKNSNGKFYASDYGVHNFDTSVQLNGCYYTKWDGIEHLYSTTASVVIDTSDGTSSGTTGAGNWFVTGKMSNFGFSGTNTNSVGVKLLSSGGDFFVSIDATTFNTGWLLKPSTGKQVLYPFFTSCLGDSCLTDAWVVDGSDGLVYSGHAVNCWGAYSTNGSGLVTKGSSLDGFFWNSGRLRENGKYGWDHQGGVNCQVGTSEIASNSKLTSNTYDGVHVSPNVSSWGVLNSRIGNFASSLSTQANGVLIESGTSSSFRITGNDLSNTGAGKVPVSNGSSSTNYTISQNLPLQNVGNNTSGRISLSGGTAGTPPAGSTNYIGANGYGNVARYNPFVVATPGVVSGFYAAVTTAPGAGQSFTYTVYKNGAATSMTGVISGASSFSVTVFSNAFTAEPTDLVTLELITSAGAALSIHSFSIFLEP